MERLIKLDDEFAASMQQLSAEAQRLLPEGADPDSDSSQPMRDHLSLIVQECRFLKAHISGIEETLAQRFTDLNDQIGIIRSTEGLNQRLFDSLHEELIKYRDNFLRESLQKPFIRDLLLLYDDLSTLLSQLKTSGKNDAKRVTQPRDNLENSIHSLVEILHRLEVTEIAPTEKVDRSIHRVVSYEPTDIPEEDGMIVMRLKRVFRWHADILRPEEVIAKRYN
jgi:molecular chaperone GrpE (heat shock protein)